MHALINYEEQLTTLTTNQNCEMNLMFFVFLMISLYFKARSLLRHAIVHVFIKIMLGCRMEE